MKKETKDQKRNEQFRKEAIELLCAVHAINVDMTVEEFKTTYGEYKSFIQLPNSSLVVEYDNATFYYKFDGEVIKTCEVSKL